MSKNFDNDWNDLNSQPAKGDICEVMVIKKMTFEGHDENGNSKWKELSKGVDKFLKWRKKKNSSIPFFMHFPNIGKNKGYYLQSRQDL